MVLRYCASSGCPNKFGIPQQKEEGGTKPGLNFPPLGSLFFNVLVEASGRGSRAGERVQLEFHQLELRYERLRMVRPEQERRLLASLAEVGQQVPIVVVQPALQQRVQRGEIVAHGAAKYLVPLARANRQACLELVEAMGSTRVTSADLGILYRAYQTGNWVTRQRLLEAPLMFLKSHKQAQAPSVVVEAGPGDNLLSDLEVLSSAARRADRRLRQGALRNLADEQRQELARCLDQSLHETQRLAERFHQEVGSVGSEHASCDSEAPRARA